MDFEVIPNGFMSFNEKIIATGRLVAFLVVIFVLLRMYRPAHAGIGLIVILLLVYVYANFAGTYENFVDDVCMDNAPFSALNTDPRLYAQVRLPVRSHVLEEWNSSPFAIHSHINSPTSDPLDYAGFLVPEALPRPYVDGPPPSTVPHVARLRPEHLDSGPRVKFAHAPSPPSPPAVRKTHRPDSLAESTPRVPWYGESLPGDVNEMGGWNPDKLILHGNPTNQPMAPREYDPQLAPYHETRRMGILQPGVYTTTEINEPQITNMGISFTQQFAPVTEERHADMTVYTQRDPRLYKPAEHRPAYKFNVQQSPYATVNVTGEPEDPAFVFDPRSAGYGDARRAYIEPVTGQPRWYYDDIDSIRADPFVRRTRLAQHIDDREVPLNTMHQVADQAFIECTNQHRLDLQERLMRKANEMRRQRRIAPIRTF